MQRRSNLIPGLILLLLGGYFLARNLGVRMPGLNALWPVFPLGFGLLLLARYLGGEREDPGQVFVGTVALLIGAFFFLFTLDVLRWGQMGVFWPAFVLIGGAGFLAHWAARPSDRGVLVPALLALIVGGIALLFTLGRVEPVLGRQIARFWPVALIILGLAILIGRRRRQT